MTITDNKVVLMHYELKNSKGEVLDSSQGKDPLAFIQGKGNIIPGLEKEMKDKKTGNCWMVYLRRRIKKFQIVKEKIE